MSALREVRMALTPTGAPRIDGAELLSRGRATRYRSGAMPTQALMSEAVARKLVAAAVEAVARSQELLEQVRRRPGGQPAGGKHPRAPQRPNGGTRSPGRPRRRPAGDDRGEG